MTLLLHTNATHIEIHPLDWPRCGQCRMPVEYFCLYDSPEALTIVALCHGSDEVVAVPNDVMTEMLGSYLKIGSAFMEERYDV